MSRHRTEAAAPPSRWWAHGLAGFASGVACTALVLLSDPTGEGPLVQPWDEGPSTSPTSSACVASSTTYPDGQTWHGCDPAVFRPSLPAPRTTPTTTRTTTSSPSVEETPGPAQLPPDNPFEEGP